MSRATPSSTKYDWMLERWADANGYLDDWNEVKDEDVSAFSFDEIMKGEARDYAGTCPRCQSDNTKKTKSQTGTIIGLCNDCGNTWKLKETEAPAGSETKAKPQGGESDFPLGGMKGEPRPPNEYGHELQVQRVDQSRQKDNPAHAGPSPFRKEEEPDPSNPSRELNPDPEIPEPIDAGQSKEPDDGDQIHMQSQTYTADGIDLPDQIEIPERLYNDLMMMIEYSTSNDNEAGGFLIRAKHGEIGVVGEQFGKDREIVLEPNEELHEGEALLGTVHMHPVTPTASTGDVKGYLNDHDERIMVVVGADKSINFFFKIDGMTHEGDYGDEISENFEQSDMDMMAEGFGFLWYRGEQSDRTKLHLMDNKLEDIEFNVLDETWPVEDVIDSLSIKGRPDIPDSYSTKKTPMRVTIPFSYNCTELRLKA